ncbi:hypothetical protein [Sphingobium sp. HWE2-09]|uniref:hypothetical protein n=1 Tax=Sphingobium sp. HWE2-09 TaxID=3108390 RepID=UPI002DC798E2|nr:hypothetical protein [Sphingobium sp. HWE2-09]
MLLDDAKFPLVRMHYNHADEQGEGSGFERFEALLERRKPFVLIGLGAQPDKVQSIEERKQVTLWMKRNRPALHTYVRAMVYVEPSPAKRFLAKASAPVFQKFWGYPIVVAASEPDAEAVAARLLAGESAADIEVEKTDT